MKRQKSSENVNTNKALKSKGGGGGGSVGGDGDESLDVDEEIFSLVSTVVQWYLVLEEVSPLTDLSSETGPPRCRGLFRGIASPAILCHKEPARGIQSPLLGFFMA